MTEDTIAYLKDMVHKINSPLTTVIGYSQLLERKRISEMGDKEEEWLKIMNEELLRIKSYMIEISESIHNVESAGENIAKKNTVQKKRKKIRR
jgi:signal transduction histidine kinase